MGEQAPAVDKAASGGWALNPRHECRGTSPVMIAVRGHVKRRGAPAASVTMTALLLYAYARRLLVVPDHQVMSGGVF
jgi:hypothetical protein